LARMIDLTNKKYGKLTVIKLTGERGPSGQIYWECKCDCGNIHVTSGESLRGGKSKSCGCARKTPHNKVRDREYAIKKQLYKTNVEKRSQRLGFDYNISLEDYIKLIEQPCFYCGIKDSNYATDVFIAELKIVIMPQIDITPRRMDEKQAIQSCITTVLIE